MCICSLTSSNGRRRERETGFSRKGKDEGDGDWMKLLRVVL
jgi:hypothetical protein